MKSKTYILIIMLVIGCFSSVYTKPVNIETAKLVAKNWYYERSEKHVKNAEIRDVFTERDNSENIFYIFNLGEKGFVIVAADDVSIPILGYSSENNYTGKNQPPAFEFLMRMYKMQIVDAKKNNLSPFEKTKDEWERLTVDSNSFIRTDFRDVLPMLTTVWDQGQYFNTSCPVDTAGPDDHVYAGCVATAMAQVINYWEHPWHGEGSHNYTHGTYGTISADFENTLYDYDNMPDTVSAYNIDVATLMYHCGVSVNMDYGPNSSGAWGWNDHSVSNALKDYFYFDDDAHHIVRSAHTMDWWRDRMKTELDAKRPVIYGGTDIQNDWAGHAWVIDGYGGDYFHMNWGWSGNHDGYFLIDEPAPGNGYNFDDYMCACVNAEPKVAHLDGTWDIAGSPYYIDYDQVIDEDDLLTIEPGVEVMFRGRYSLIVNGTLLAEGTPADSITFDADNSIIGWKGIRFFDTNATGQDTSRISYCDLMHGIAKGGYDPEETHGGAIYCTNSSALVIENSSFSWNFADHSGGAICLKDTSNIIINNSVIEWNTAESLGGGINCNYSNPSLDNVTISGNTASWHAGGIACQYASPTLTNLTISDNTANNYGGGIFCYDYSNPNLNNVTISNNEANANGGGMYISSYSNPVLDSVYIFDNTATYGVGGGMSICGVFGVCQPSISNVKIYDNTANYFGGGGGGGIYCGVDARPYICLSQIYRNIADKGGGIYCIDTDYTELEKVTVANNIAYDGPEIYVDNSDIILLSTIVWNDYYGSADVYLDNGGTITATYSDIQNASGEPWFGYGCIDADPLFTDPENNDYTPSWSGYPLPDENKSPCIDSGSNISPLDPDGTIADMGALYFHQSFTPLSGGDISGTLLAADSPYFVDGDLTIPAGDQLTIEPGVSVIFIGHYKFNIYGSLLAEGTETDRINFAASDTLEGFRGLRFINTNTARQDSSKLVHCRITFGNSNGYRGGGLYFDNSSNVRVQNCLINKNMASSYGGAIYCSSTSTPKFINNIITGNSALFGGAIYSQGDFSLTGGEIYDNLAEYGGAIYSYAAAPLMSGTTIRNNTATLYGGGFYFYGGAPVFSSTNRCNIYLNYAKAAGQDFFAVILGTISVFVDTFTVLYPDKHFAYPYDDFTFDIQHYKIEQLAQDLYVSPSGSDDNSGTSSSEPLQTMNVALLKIMADSLNQRTIHLENGTYSYSATGENFPINCRENVSISGESESLTILDGGEQTGILYCYDDSNFTLENLTLQNGYAENGGAIYLENNSNPDLVNVTCTGNEATNDGGAIYCIDNSSPNLTNVIITNNTASGDGAAGGGICCRSGSCPALAYVAITYNYAYSGGGIYSSGNCNLTLNNVVFLFNSVFGYGGGYFIRNSDPVLNNVSFSGNSAENGGAIYSSSSDPQLYDVTLMGNSATRNGGGIHFSQSNLDITNSSFAFNISGTGGGISGYNLSTLNIKNTIFDNNSAEEEPCSPNSGGALYLQSVTTTIVNTTIGFNDSSDDGDGIYCSNSNISLINSILWADTLIYSGGTVNATYSDIQYGTGQSWFGTGCIDTDPLFADPSIYNLHLTDSSPCINAGNPDTTGLNLPEYDLDGNPRIVNDTIDMGCYEWQGADYDISGNIGYFSDDAAIPNAEVNLTGDDTYSATTTTSGDYLFNNIPGGNYVSIPSKADDLGGLSGTDASRIARYVALLYEFDCLEMITADVSMNGNISGTDASRVARYVALLITDLNTDSIHWVFTPEPIPECEDWPPIVYENIREYSPLNSDLTDEDFIGIRLGDVSGNWSPEARMPLIQKSSPPGVDPSEEATKIEASVNSTLIIPIVIENVTEIEGIDIEIKFNPEVLKLKELTLQDGILDNKDYAIETNLSEPGKGIMVIYAQRDLVSEIGVVAFLEFDVVGKEETRSDVYFTKFDVNETEGTGGLQIVDSENNEIVTRRLEVNIVQPIPDKLALYPNYPNPFTSKTVIKYDLPQDVHVNIQIFNVRGQLVEELFNGVESAGRKQIEWVTEGMSSGIYFYRLSTKDKTLIKKMVLMK